MGIPFHRMEQNKRAKKDFAECVFERKEAKFKCKALIELDCLSCNFRKTMEQAHKGESQRYEKLRGLTEGKQRFISKKYYGGKMPWKSI